MQNIDYLRRELDEVSRRRTPKLHSGRGVPVEETLARIRPLMTVAGITRVADVTGLDTLGIPVVMVVRPNARSLSVAQGKGLDLSAAKISATGRCLMTMQTHTGEKLVKALQIIPFVNQSNEESRN
jgi:YcaO-like protein with predicted kinase domain